MAEEVAMLEKQRIHLEELIDELVRVELEVAKYFNTDKAGVAMKAREKAKDDIRGYLDFIQSYVGAVTFDGVHRGPDSLPRQTIREED
jgi:hypothetical protein